MKKSAFILCLLLFLSLPLSAHEGSMAGSGKLRVSQTKYFDIIYSSKNLEAAQIIYENADAIFEELCAAYDMEPYFRIPVVITSTVEQFNAYYADAPFNRIVLYDTAQIEDLSVFSQTILSTFTHELTHAVTYNHKNKVFRVLAKLFGDAFSAYYLSVTSGMAEGATVSYESSNGEGRLNDAYALQMVRQAKIEDKFPSYSDVKGASDAYPRGAFYYFNGAFAEYLQKTYGMQKYADFWYRCINGKNLTAAGAFKKAYGIKLDQAWKQFETSFEVPKVAAAEPVAGGIARDFFDDAGDELSIKNRSGSRYSNLCVSKTGIAFIDDSCETVYFYSNGKIKRLFAFDYIDTISLSSDGRFLAVGYYTQASPTIKHCARIYDLQYKKWIDVKGTNYAGPSVIYTGDNYYFVAQSYENQKYFVCVKTISVDGSRAKVSTENLVQHYFDPEQVPQSFTDLGNGTFAFILKSGLEYSVCVSDVTLSQLKEYKAPVERMKIKDLSAAYSGSEDSQRLVFSWATKETLPRLGYLDLSEDSFEFALSQENISGGIYTPVEYNGHVYYTAQFYKETRLLELVNPARGVEVQQGAGLQQPEVPVQALQVDLQPQELPYKKFNPFGYTFEGLLVPIGGLNSSTPTLGFTYLTSMPWYSNLVTLSGGYDFSKKAGIFDLSYQSGTDTSLFQYYLYSSFAVDNNGFKYFTGSGTVGTSFDFGRISLISLSVQADAKYGRIIGDSMNTFLSTLQFASVGYSNVIKTGPGTYEKAGITFITGVAHSNETQKKPVTEKIDDVYDVEFGLSVYVPKLIPLTCVDNFTYNLPAKIKTSFFSLSSSSMRLAKVNAEAVLFGYDIQKAIPGITAIYANDVIVTLGYTGGFDYLTTKDFDTDWHFLKTPEYLKLIKDGTIEYKDYFTVKLSVGLTPNIGSFANPQARFNLYSCFRFGKKNNVPNQFYEFGFEAKF